MSKVKNGRNRAVCVISGGKDGIFAYFMAKKSGQPIVELLNFYNNDNDVSFHYYQKEVVSLQAKSMGLSLVQKKIIVQDENKNLLEKRLFEIFSDLKKNNIHRIIFGYVLGGDYQDKIIRKICKKLKIKLILPNYKRSSMNILKNIVSSGISAIITAVDDKYIDKKWLGKIVDEKFIDYLRNKKNINPCGDKGEYHTLVVDAPFFSKKIEIEKMSKEVRQLDGYDYNCLKIEKFCLIDKN